MYFLWETKCEGLSFAGYYKLAAGGNVMLDSTIRKFKSLLLNRFLSFFPRVFRIFDKKSLD